MNLRLLTYAELRAHEERRRQRLRANVIMLAMCAVGGLACLLIGAYFP